MHMAIAMATAMAMAMATAMAAGHELCGPAIWLASFMAELYGWPRSVANWMADGHI